MENRTRVISLHELEEHARTCSLSMMVPRSMHMSYEAKKLLTAYSYFKASEIVEWHQ